MPCFVLVLFVYFRTRTENYLFACQLDCDSVSLKLGSESMTKHMEAVWQQKFICEDAHI